MPAARERTPVRFPITEDLPLDRLSSIPPARVARVAVALGGVVVSMWHSTAASMMTMAAGRPLQLEEIGSTERVSTSQSAFGVECTPA